ncbi:CTP synthase [Bifidobacterium callitrichidarum]|uniref:CTP synthase n=1 Tax=Bifidobacterium callitrichidarum TaxID=2052941 RepID=A0A2U2N776_9BIFI|nr:CTP synthase [Bifidobacterium callitrichidarum]PWG65045.1 CTP synthase [Bifidobacterium callitrichidarum]
MRTHHVLDQLISDAERNLRCFYPPTNTLRQAVLVRVRNGYVTRTFRNAYARTDYWKSLNAAEQSRHIIRTLSLQFPNRVFAGLSAAAILQLDYSWSLHRDNAVFVTQQTGTSARTYQGIQRISASTTSVTTMLHYRTGSGINTLFLALPPESPRIANITIGGRKPEITNIVPITSPAQTLVDCGLQFSFMQALPMFDSAARKHLITAEQIIEVCDQSRMDCSRVLRLVHYMNPLSENGGESLCRAVIIEAGFAVPDLQHVFMNPDAPWREYRVDFVWHTPAGRIIALEFDGTAKYVDPAMTNRRNIQQVVNAEQEREAGLRKAGVSTIIRTNYDEAVQQTPLIRKLFEAGVPMVTMNPFFERATDVSGRMI